MINAQRTALPKAFREANERRLLVRFSPMFDSFFVNPTNSQTWQKKRVVTLPQITTGSTRRLPRWEECTQETMGFMDWAVGRLYVEEVFNNEFQVQVNFSHCLLKVLLKRAVERI